MKATALGIYYVQCPSGIVVDRQGQILTPKVHNRSLCVIKDGKRAAVSKLPHLTYTAAMEFKEIFC